MGRRRPVSKFIIITLASLITYLSISSVLRAVKPSLFVWSEEDLEEAEWLATSKSWWDRKFCRFFGLCGIAHVRLSRKDGPPSRTLGQMPIDYQDDSWRMDWTLAEDLSANWTNSERVLREVPEYVFEYAPLVHLFSGESFWPGDIAEHLVYTTPTLNYTPVQAKWDHPTLQDLDRLNRWELGKHVYLTSGDDVETRPAWLGGERNIPVPPQPGTPDPEEPVDDTPGNSPVSNEGDDRKKWYDAGGWNDDVDAHSVEMEESEILDFEHTVEELRKRYTGKPIKTTGVDRGRSDAPAFLVVVDKGNDIVDAFWFFFYSYNLGNTVFDVRFGNHVGDWEHTMVRFYKGHPKALFLSAHTAGEAYSYEAVEKQGKRPVVYSATGTHAMYATPGIHEYVLPWGLLHDQTDRGPLWDPLLNSHYFTYDYLSDVLRASNLNPSAPTEWFFFNGHWGDKFYPLGDRRQYRFAGQYHYVNGPLGPRFKHLGRRKVCQGRYTSSCVIRNFVEEEKRSKRWVGVGVGEEPEDEELSSIMERRTNWLMTNGINPEV
ncbi:conserved hypothetical protein [Talaromyces stipitatus ATCC 10500]|uniref:Vacuolar protein sorting protein 62 n=1 Tax=Talaromyces stipitatus (strain ATCC 10500 / CBS 375.48 / QM 6759 / NRRL 1006) TaxID=441959 RepID=B8LT71_TALSN|nr:uncharacterized protein TSTA_069930 [Talaromyces stipitatus ATCC 10500]EED23579.1 conserved hypothetical protein [Talaromyces stipitatus ATCC 10500]